MLSASTHKNPGSNTGDIGERLGIVVKPNGHHWERDATFNAGVTSFNNSIYILYRAFGKDHTSVQINRKEGISRFGLGIFKSDGVTLEKTFTHPVLEPRAPYEEAGIEDPRITYIAEDGTYYITYTATEIIGKDVIPRIALASTKDFIHFLSHGIILPDPEDVFNKDAVLFPKKINDEYVMLHRRGGKNIWIAYSKDLLNWYDHKEIMKVREGYWDNLKLGAGAPPIKTAEGWLIFYHGVDNFYVYRAGAALLDLRDPSKVLTRTDGSILEPREEYEHKGVVSNVVFPCGAIRNGRGYHLYYGGGDRVTAAALIPYDKLDSMLKPV
ncbi:MAG: glycosidase [Thermodesulfobacteriota bacterium]